MIIINKDIKDIQSSNNYIALGSFDGLHIGHLSLIYKVVEIAKKNDGKSMVFTFKNHPKTLIDKGSIPKLLMNNDRKVEILRSHKVDIVCFQEFNLEFMKMTPKEFVEFLVFKYNVKGFIVGFNYKFGYKNLGNVEFLKSLQSKYGYELYVMEPCTYKNEVISSTRIRKALEAGEVLDAGKMLSLPYTLSGKIIHGRQIGRTIGFPTANLQYEENFILPKAGVYYTNIMVNNNIYKGITSIGSNPTVDGKAITVETYILDFDREIYGEKINLSFIKKIRDMEKFNGIEELKSQLERDRFFAQNENYMSSLRI
ncbi:riboflavin biosynthesis protein RibF [Clostridium puniceum]|uniref:Riboflavin biosynthesis protein n=1 Tax=Clostridium puniceum TaxID=29367 RepID=A0A1S8T3G7_9CLOT|nr:bifunctional riboflavin kinase/FAD synthetase [Clostridium puniceum]OOM72316.1 riboflavin biosynthesis protein RibF [Clostridium puniceum]